MVGIFSNLMYLCPLLKAEFVPHTVNVSTVLLKSFAHLNQDFLLPSLEERGKLWKLSKVGPPPPGGLQKIHEINVRNF